MVSCTCFDCSQSPKDKKTYHETYESEQNNSRQRAIEIIKRIGPERGASMRGPGIRFSLIFTLLGLFTRSHYVFSDASPCVLFILPFFFIWALDPWEALISMLINGGWNPGWKVKTRDEEKNSFLYSRPFFFSSPIIFYYSSRRKISVRY